MTKCLLLLVLVCGCSTKVLPPRARLIDRLDLVGADKVEPAAVKRRIASQQTERILAGSLEGVPMLGLIDAITVQYHTYDRFVLQRDLVRVRRFYRARGFYDAHVRAGRVIDVPGRGVRVEIEVDEGEPVLVERVDYDFPDQQGAFRANAQVYEVVAAYSGRKPTGAEPLPRFDEDEYNKVEVAIRKALTDNGYAYGRANGKVEVDLRRRRAVVKFFIEAGPHCEFGEVFIDGLGDIPERPVRAAVGIEAGAAYSTRKLDEAQFALADMQVFGSIEVRPELTRDPKKKRATRINVRVRVQPIKLRVFKVGVGAEVGTQLEVHGVVGWEHRNFLGGLRKLSVEALPGLVFFPTRAATLFTEPPTHILPEAQLLLTFTQPAFPERLTNLQVSGGVRIYSPQASPVPEVVPSDYNIVGYRETDGSFGFDRKLRFPYLGGSIVYLGQFFKVQFDDPFSYNLDQPPDGFVRVLIPYLETSASWDFRKGADGKPNSVRPVRGAYFGLNAQFAGGFLHGDADDVRLRPEVRLYTRVSHGLVLALRWTTGFLVPRNYGDSLSDTTADSPADARDLQILSFRAFYSGGPYSNRGYGYREVGPHGLLPYLSQRGVSTELLPTGGLGMWELSAELRAGLSANVSVVLFIDSSDVVASLSEYRLTHPHIAPGLGLRIHTPVGPLRVDLGVRVPYLQRLGQKYLLPEEGGPRAGESDSFPVEPSLAIGEAF